MGGVKRCSALGLVLASLLTAVAAAQVDLPQWAQHAARTNERVFHSEICGKQCYIIAATSAGDSLGGRVIRIARDDDMIAKEVVCSWVASDLSGPHAYVRVFDSIALADARAALEAARPLLLAGEYTWKVYMQEGMRVENGQVVGTRKTGALCVALGAAQASGGRELLVKSVSGTFVAVDKGARWYH